MSQQPAARQIAQHRRGEGQLPLPSLPLPSAFCSALGELTPPQELSRSKYVSSPAKPGGELRSRNSCKADRWLPARPTAAFTCQTGRNWCLKNWRQGLSTGEQELHCLHLHSLPALCKTLPPSKGSELKGDLDFGSKMSCSSA